MRLWRGGSPVAGVPSMAYHLKAYQVLGPGRLMAPLESDVARYDIQARAENASVAKMREVMKHLIAECFRGCAAHGHVG